MDKLYDVIIIGSGVVGNAIAREMSRYNLKIGVLEKELDVCNETSARNSGVLHAGFNNKPGTLMAKFCVEGNQGFDQVAKELGVPFKRCGKLVVGFSEEDKEKLIAMKEQGEKNGVKGLEIIGKDKIKEIEPNIDGEFAMWSKTTGILNPFLLTIALAENAAANGAEYYFGNEVIDIKRVDDIYNIKTKKDTYKTRWVVNAAGLYSDKVSKMLGIDDYTIHPCRGEYFILDEKVGSKLSLPAYPVPNPKEGGLGIHLTPTIDGNVFIGPSSEYIDERDDYSATQKIMDLLIKDGGRIFPHIRREEFIRNFAGIRPKLASKEEGGYHDFVIEMRDKSPNTINLVGIESPGLTSSTPIAKYVVSLLKQKEELTENENFNPIRKPIVTFNDKSVEEKEALIKENPDYGEVICRCQTITKAEILEAINNPLGVETLTGIKYRCRAMMGRCQGGYCETRIAGLLEEVKHKNREDVLYSREGSNMFVGKVRD